MFALSNANIESRGQLMLIVYLTVITNEEVHTVDPQSDECCVMALSKHPLFINNYPNQFVLGQMCPSILKGGLLKCIRMFVECDFHCYVGQNYNTVGIQALIIIPEFVRLVYLSYTNGEIVAQYCI